MVKILVAGVAYFYGVFPRPIQYSISSGLDKERRSGKSKKLLDSGVFSCGVRGCFLVILPV
jgi:hypothetical protein